MRNEALTERLTYDRPISMYKLATLVADKAQVTTQHYGGRPYGVGLLLGGVDESGPHLWECSPTGNYYEYYAMAIGSRSQPARTYLERHFKDFIEGNDKESLIQHGLSALWESLPSEKTNISSSSESDPSLTTSLALNSSNTAMAIIGPFTEKSLEARELSTEEIEGYLTQFFSKKREEQKHHAARESGSDEQHKEDSDGILRDETGVIIGTTEETLSSTVPSPSTMDVEEASPPSPDNQPQ